jgi:hypothetical protein
MRKILLLSFILTTSFYAIAQTSSPEFGSCFSKANKKSIHNKMDKLLARVSKETNCPKDKLTVSVSEYYNGFYSKSCRHLPKKITIEACGEKRTYKQTAISGAILYWLLGSWTMEK